MASLTTEADMKITVESHAKTGHMVYTFPARGGGIWNQLGAAQAVAVLSEESRISEREAKRLIDNAAMRLAREIQSRRS